MFRRNVLLLLAALVGITAIYFPRTAQQPEQPKKYPGRNNTVLFISNADAGLANVVLATSYALISEHGDLEVHYGTVKKFAKPIQRLNKLAAQRVKGAGVIKYHEFTGRDFVDTVTTADDDIDDLDGAMHRHGLDGFGKLLGNMNRFLMPWPAPDYLYIYKEAVALIEQVDPAVVIVEPLFFPGVDAIRATGRREVIVSPNALVEAFGDRQPLGSVLWKYPFMSSGLKIPVPVSKIPVNIYIGIRLAYAAFRDPILLRKRAWLRANGINNPCNIATMYNKETTWLSAGSFEAEAPLPAGIPSNAIGCGPIYLSDSASEQDPALAKWLKNAPTVLINLGSRATFTEEGATEMVRALRTVFDNFPVQVLWKFNKRKPYSDDFLSIVSRELANGRLKLEKWITADPASLLETGDIVLFVHHGGAGCYQEAVNTGVAQVVLPMWADCYDYATRAEYLGIGVWGNEKSSPYFSAGELEQSFLRVLGNGTESMSIREKAAALGKIRQSKKPGRSVAADEVSRLARLGGSTS